MTPDKSHAVYQKMSFSVTLSDLSPDFEVRAFFEGEQFGPEWSYIRYGTGYSTSNRPRPIWSITDINASRVSVSISWASSMFYWDLVKNTFLHNAHVTRSYRLRFNCEKTRMACAIRSDFHASLQLRMNEFHSPWRYYKNADFSLSSLLLV